MQQALRRSSLVPRGFVVESAYYEADKAIVLVRASGPVCIVRNGFRRVDSRYRHRVTDLPLTGRIVELLVIIARPFRCDAVLCGRQIFSERFAEGVLTPSARPTARLDSIVHHLGLALGVDRRQALQNRWCCRSATTRSCALSDAAAVRRLSL